LIILAEEHLGLLDWNGQDHLTRKVLVSGAHSIFSANPRTIAWTRGRSVSRAISQRVQDS
jgi:hypothetical protein